jgi:gluconolactonase
MMMNSLRLIGCLYLFCYSAVVDAQSAEDKGAIVAPGAELQQVAADYKFTEGPAVDAQGNVFFTDQPNNRIMK